MWIIPKNYQPSSVFVLATVESKEDLSLQGLNIESSLMWRSKPSPLRTWSQRWSRVSWFRLLSTRILRPSHLISFETQLTSSLEDIRANRLAWQEERLQQKNRLVIPDTSSPTSSTMSEQLDLLSASSRMSKDTSVEDLRVSSETYQKMVLKARSGYLGRKTSASSTNGKESISLPTPTASSAEGGRQKIEYRNGFKTYRSNSNQWFGSKLRSALEINQDKDFIANPAFVEEMMGLPIGWTDIDS